MTEYHIAFEDALSPEEQSIVHQGLGNYNESQVGDGHYEKLSLLVRDGAGNVVGGLFGATYWGWLHIETLWIDGIPRGRGYGSKLIAAAEAQAIKRGCRNSFVDTTSFQAKPFYERLGYKVFGMLEHCPGKHKRFFMQKALADESGKTDSWDQSERTRQ